MLSYLSHSLVADCPQDALAQVSSGRSEEISVLFLAVTMARHRASVSPHKQHGIMMLYGALLILTDEKHCVRLVSCTS